MSEQNLIEFAKEPYSVYFFTDLGAGQIKAILKHLGTKIIFILDHHSFDKKIIASIPKNIMLLNPHVFDIDGSTEISGSGVAYFFAEAMNQKNMDLAHLGVIGAIGDTQEKKEFVGKDGNNVKYNEGTLILEDGTLIKVSIADENIEALQAIKNKEGNATMEIKADFKGKAKVRLISFK